MSLLDRSDRMYKVVSQTSTLAIDFVYKIAAKCHFDMLYDKVLKK
jgi:hypothetical protein